MAQEEKYGSRDLTYSAWHRRNSISRFVGIEAAQTLAMIDADVGIYVECDDQFFEPLAIIETARDVGQNYKCAKLTKNLAKRAYPRIGAFLVLYTPGNSENPAAPFHWDIIKFRVRRLWPEPETDWEELTPEQWAKKLILIRKHFAKEFDNWIKENHEHDLLNH